MEMFSNDAITIIRRKDGDFLKETITTKKMLPGSSLSEEAIRKSAILRLRKDPSVVFVLEGRDGHCHETAELPDGFEMTLDLKAGEHAQGTITVTHGPAKDIAFQGGFGLDGKGREFDEEDIFTACIDDAIEILDMTAMGDYSFVNEDCPGFDESTQVDSEEEPKPMPLWDIEQALISEGFQVEPILIPGGGVPPFMFVHENELIMFGSMHFNGESLFVEKKRTFWWRTTEENEESQRKANLTSMAKVRHLKDDSWSFRTWISIKEGDSVMEKLSIALDQLNESIRYFEDPHSNPESIDAHRQLFIYEVLDASLALDALPI